MVNEKKTQEGIETTVVLSNLVCVCGQRSTVLKTQEGNDSCYPIWCGQRTVLKTQEGHFIQFGVVNENNTTRKRQLLSNLVWLTFFVMFTPGYIRF